MKAQYNNARISSKKVNLVAGLVRGKNAIEAENILRFTPKKAAKLILKALKSAMANAQNNLAQNKENLTIKSILITNGTFYKRGIPVSRGRMHPILRRNTHITVELKINENTIKKETLKNDTATQSHVEKIVKKVRKTEKKMRKPKLPLNPPLLPNRLIA